MRKHNLYGLNLTVFLFHCSPLVFNWLCHFFPLLPTWVQFIDLCQSDWITQLDPTTPFPFRHSCLTTQVHAPPLCCFCAVTTVWILPPPFNSAAYRHCHGRALQPPSGRPPRHPEVLDHIWVECLWLGHWCPALLGGGRFGWSALVPQTAWGWTGLEGGHCHPRLLDSPWDRSRYW